MSPELMPKSRCDLAVRWLLKQPRLVVAWEGHMVTLMAGPMERTVNANTHPEIIEQIRTHA